MTRSYSSSAVQRSLILFIFCLLLSLPITSFAAEEDEVVETLGTTDQFSISGGRAWFWTSGKVNGEDVDGYLSFADDLSHLTPEPSEDLGDQIRKWNDFITSGEYLVFYRREEKRFVLTTDFDAPPAIEAVLQKDLAALSNVILEKEQLEAKDRLGRTALLVAVNKGLPEAVRLLIDAGADVNATDAEAVSALCQAVDNGDSAMVNLLISSDATVDCRGESGAGPLLVASAMGKTNIARLLLSQNIDVNVRSDSGLAPIHAAATFGAGDLVDLLAESGADLQLGDKDGNSPLHLAAKIGNQPTLEALLGLGAQVEARNSAGMTPLQIAAQSGFATPVKLLLTKGADVDSAGDNGSTALILSAVGGHLEAVQILLDHNADLHAETSAGVTALSAAVSVNSSEIAAALVAKGARITGTDPRHLDAVAQAIAKNEPGALKAYLDAGVDPNVTFEEGTSVNFYNSGKAKVGQKGRTVLMFAAWQGNLEAAKVLVEHGADVNKLNYEQSNALVFTLYEPHRDIAKFLISQNIDLEQRSGPLKKSPLMIALDEPGADMIAIDLLRAGAKPVYRLEDGTRFPKVTIDRQDWYDFLDGLASFEKNQRGAVRFMQKALNTLGFDTGRPDGVAGQKTQSAIAAFQDSKGTPENTEITVSLVLDIAEAYFSIPALNRR